MNIKDRIKEERVRTMGQAHRMKQSRVKNILLIWSLGSVLCIYFIDEMDSGLMTRFPSNYILIGTKTDLSYHYSIK